MGVKYDKNAVVITKAPTGFDYSVGQVQLPKDYGTPAYDARPEVKAIKETVRKSLDDLDAATGWKAKFKGQKVLIKPNLVFVTPPGSYRWDYEIPQTTDPRVFDATMEVLTELCSDVVIGEGSGFVTWTNAKMAGYDRIAKKYNTRMVFFEEQPVERYFCPKAEVGQDVYVPQAIGEVIRGERLYVSHPKMKTNVYTGVTLGFKNSMGTFSQNMRFRNHTYQINKKLTDLLYLFKPDLTVIDALVGGGGNTPGPNIPVYVNKIITGTNSVEVDRVATYMMGFDPAENKLMQEADKRGFGDPNVEVIGEKEVTPFQPADPSLLSDRFRSIWPNVKEYVGYTNPHVPKLTKLDGIPFEDVVAMESFDYGGTPSTISTTMEVMYASYTYKLNKNRHLNIIVGEGAEFNGKKYWLGADGHAYSLEELKALKGPTMVFGENSAPAKEAATKFFFVRGWGEIVNSAARLFIAMMPSWPGQFHPPYLPLHIAGYTRKYLIKVAHTAMGHVTEPKFDAYSDKIYTIPEYVEKNLDCDFVQVPLPKLGLKGRWDAIKDIRWMGNFLF